MSVVSTSDGGPPAEISVNKLQMKGCKETTIGTRIDLQGKFVVNQFLRFDSPPPASELSAIRDALVKDATKKKWWEKLPLRSLSVGLIVAVLLCAGIVGTTFLVKNDGNRSNDDLPQNFTARFRSRSDWQALPPKASRALTYRPARSLVVAHTGGTTCSTPINCEVTVRALQNGDFQLNRSDLQYNFLLGGDGLVYEGRGWGVEGGHTFGVDCASLGVAFVGDFNYLRPEQAALDALYLLIEESLERGELATDYKLFFKQQFSAMGNSPGKYVIEKLQNIKHHSNVTKDDILCR